LLPCFVMIFDFVYDFFSLMNDSCFRILSFFSVSFLYMNNSVKKSRPQRGSLYMVAVDDDGTELQFHGLGSVRGPDFGLPDAVEQPPGFRRSDVLREPDQPRLDVRRRLGAALPRN